MGIKSPMYLYYVYCVAVVLAVSLAIGLYRFHLKEISKLERMQMGFLRIRVAARNFTNPGFQTEVRTALTAGAFDFIEPGKTPKPDAAESPLPGHPGSDAGTAVLNKILEKLDVVLTPKKD